MIRSAVAADPWSAHPALWAGVVDGQPGALLELASEVARARTAAEAPAPLVRAPAAEVAGAVRPYGAAGRAPPRHGGVAGNDVARPFGLRCAAMAGLDVTRAQSVEDAKLRAPQVEFLSLREIYQAAARAPADVRGAMFAEADKLLEGDYYPGYQRAFPDPDERESIDALKGYLRDPEMPNYDIRLMVHDGKIVGGTHVDRIESTGREVMADVLERMRKQSVKGEVDVEAVLSRALKRAEARGTVESESTASMTSIQYIWVDEEHRWSGLGKKALDDITHTEQKAGESMGLFAEVNDPRQMSPEQRAEDSIDPLLRNAFYHFQDFHRAGAKYVQLPIEEGGGSVDYLAFLMKNLGDKQKEIPADLYLAIVTNYFATFPAFEGETFAETLKNIFAHPDYQAIVSSIGGKKTVSLDPVLNAEEMAALPPRDISASKAAEVEHDAKLITDAVLGRLSGLPSGPQIDENERKAGGREAREMGARLGERALRRIFDCGRFVLSALTSGSPAPLDTSGLREPGRPREEPASRDELASTVLTFSSVVREGLRRLGEELTADREDGHHQLWRAVGRFLADPHLTDPSADPRELRRAETEARRELGDAVRSYATVLLPLAANAVGSLVSRLLGELTSRRGPTAGN